MKEELEILYITKKILLQKQMQKVYLDSLKNFLKLEIPCEVLTIFNVGRSITRDKSTVHEN